MKLVLEPFLFKGRRLYGLTQAQLTTRFERENLISDRGIQINRRIKVLSVSDIGVIEFPSCRFVPAF